MSELFRVGIIGAGNRIVDIFKGALAVEQMQVAALADPCPESIERALGLLPNRPAVYSGAEELLSLDNIDGVIIATPNDTHKGLAKAALAAGKSLYLEKPMAISEEDCCEIEQAARKTGQKLMIGMQLRYSDVYRKMKRLCDDGAIGAPKLLFYRALRDRFRPGVNGWRMQKARSGGMILEVSVHQLDLFNWFAGAPVSAVAAFGGRDAIYQQEELLDNAILMVEYENGVKANLQAAVFAPQGAEGSGLCVVGTEGTIFHTDNEIVVRKKDRDTIRYSTSGYSRMDEFAMRGFYDYLVNSQPPLTSPQAGREAVALGILAERAIEERTIIRL